MICCSYKQPWHHKNQDMSAHTTADTESFLVSKKEECLMFICTCLTDWPWKLPQPHMAPDSHRSSKPGTPLTASERLRSSHPQPQTLYLHKEEAEREREGGIGSMTFQTSVPFYMGNLLSLQPVHQQKLSFPSFPEIFLPFFPLICVLLQWLTKQKYKCQLMQEMLKMTC